MKRFKYVFLTFFISLLVLSFLLNPLAKFIAQNQFKKLFHGSKVSIGSCSFNPFQRFALSGIEISRQPLYDFKIKHAQVKFSPGSIFRGIKGNLWETIESCDVSIEYLEAGGTRLQGGYLRAARGKNDGLIGAETLRIGKLNIKDIKGKARLESEYLFLDSLSAGTLSGLLQGSFRVNLDDFFKYQAELNLVNLDMDVFVKDFAFNEKVDVTGKVSGFLRLRGQKEKILAIDGNFSAGKDGGTLTIKDLRFLENIARGSGQALDLVVESFKNYRYNTGSINISLENSNIIFLINLDGKTGKRSLNIVWHDFDLLLKKPEMIKP